jgi:hypothetical protein
MAGLRPDASPRRALHPHRQRQPAQPAHQLKTLPWRDVPVTSDTRDRGHGRRELRTFKVTAVAAGLAFPYAAQAIQTVRRRRSLTSGKWSTETVMRSPHWPRPRPGPAQLAAALRGQWAIEDRLHWSATSSTARITLRSVPPAVRVMATLRNLAITILRLAGATSIAAALRHHSRRPGRPLHTITTT